MNKLETANQVCNLYLNRLNDKFIDTSISLWDICGTGSYEQFIKYEWFLLWGNWYNRVSLN
jgi:hypothetical protein